MSTVNVTEVLIRIYDRQPTLASQVERKFLDSGIRSIPPDDSQAIVAARARHPFPHALARAEGCPILTLDEDFRNLDVPAVLP